MTRQGSPVARHTGCATPQDGGSPRPAAREHEIAATLGMSLRMVARYTQAASQEHLAERALSRQLKAEAENEMRPNLPNTETHVYPKAKKV